MKILYISKSYIPSRTANSIHVMKMCQAFSDIGHEVVLLAPEVKKEYEKDIDNIYTFYGVKNNFKIKKLWHPNLRGGNFLYTLAIFFYLLFNKRFNLVYGRFLHGCYVSILLRYNVIFEAHDPVFEYKGHRKIVFKKLIKNNYFKKLIVISQALKSMYLSWGYLSESMIQVAHDGADEVNDFRNKINLLGYKKNIKVGYVGHLYKGKGMEVVASIANKLEKNIEIHIIGGLVKDVKFWKEKIKNKKVFFYGFVPHREVGKYINALDICLLPNQKIVFTYGENQHKDSINISEFTSPLKLFEYMSFKKPIIASNLPVIREVLNKRNSLLVECDNVELWIKAINSLKKLKNRELIGNQAFIDFKLYTWKNRASKVIN